MRCFPFAVLFVLLSGAVGANDTVAEIGAGGLEYARSADIQMVREDLYLSMDEVRVDYVFHNFADTDITALVAFPMPDITGEPYGDVSIPFPASDNFLGFSVMAGGKEIEPKLQQRASVAGVDMSRELAKRGIPLLFSAPGVQEKLEGLDRDTLERFEELGLVEVDVFDNGDGLFRRITPLWTLHSVYYWEMTFPAGRDTKVSHVYTPALGATTGLAAFFHDDRVLVDDYFAAKYCVDEGFARAARRRVGGGSMMFMSWLSYILTTGQNWYGNIGTFHLTVDKGSVDNLVSFCGEGVTKTGPTTFELTVTDFNPERDLDVLFLRAVGE